VKQVKVTLDITSMVVDIHAYLATIYPPAELLGITNTEAVRLLIKSVLSSEGGKEAKMEELRNVAREAIEELKETKLRGG